jgi:hypothetical protein
MSGQSHHGLSRVFRVAVSLEGRSCRIPSFQTTGAFPNISASLSSFGCCPSRIASRMSLERQP